MPMVPSDGHLVANRLLAGVRMRFLMKSSVQLVLLAICLVTQFGGRIFGADHDRPNILFLMTDQHRWDCIGANGNELIRTPNLADDPQHRETVYQMKDRLLHWLTTADEADQIAPRWLRPEPQNNS